jgi:hypothetical protein
MEIKTILAIITAACSLLTLLGFLWGKSYLETSWAKIAETEKARKLSYEVEMGKITATLENVERLTRTMEQVKSEFDLSKITYQIQFAKLHDRRMVVVETMYEKLYRLQISTKIFTQIMHPVISDAEAEEKARLNEVSEAYNDFRRYFPGKMLFFSNEVNEMLSKIADLYWQCLLDATELQRLRNMKATGEYLKLGFDKLDKARKSLETEIPDAINKMDAEFKKLLGVTTAP